MSAFIGIDPGVNGALACFNRGELVIEDMPTFEVKRGNSLKREVDALGVLRWLRNINTATIVTFALIEQAGCRPGQAVNAVHANGRNWGVAYGCLASMNWPTQIVTPVAWKRSMGCPAAKDEARKIASQLMPAHAHIWARAKDDGRAEAALIALYAERLYRSQETRI